MDRRRLHPAATLAVAIAVGAAIMPVHPVFEGWSWAAPLLGAVAAAALVTAVLDWTQVRSLWIALPVSVIAFVAWTFITIIPDTVTSESAAEPWQALRDGVLEGWDHLMADTVPLLDDESALIFLALLGWSATTLALHVLARRGSPIGALLAVPVVLAVAVAGALPSQLVTAAAGAIVGAALLVVVATAHRVDGDRWGLGRLATLAGVIGASVLVAVAAGDVATSTRPDPADPRRARQTEVSDIELPDLLARFSAELDAPDDEPVMLVQQPDGTAPPPMRLRLQVYDTYDGERWISSTDYRSVDELPEQTDLAAGDSVDLVITEMRLPTPLLPLPDRVTSLSAGGLRWSEETQTGLGTEGTVLTVSGVVLDPTGLASTPADVDGVDERYLVLPEGIPAELTTFAEQVTADAPDAIGQATALAEASRELGRDDSRPPGHSLGRLLADLAEETPTGPEQLAALTGVTARTIGLPSRVVVGYVVDGDEVATTDLHTWVEIPFEGRGWVATDPSPLFAETTGSVLEDDTTATSTTLPTGAVVDEPVQPRELNPDEGTDEDVATEDGIGGWLTVIIVGTGLVLALVALVGARIVRRRSRQRRPEPDLLVLGAWAELVDRLRENGRAPSSSTTTDEVVALADEIDPAVGAAARPLADLAAEALHAPLSPTRAEAKIAWDRLEDTEHALIDVRGRRVTARRLVDPRVLRYRAPEPPPRDRTAVTTAVDG